MKLPFSSIIAPLIKPYLGISQSMCQHPMFLFSIPFTYFYSLLGMLISANHLQKHLGEEPSVSNNMLSEQEEGKDFMMVHDLKIIANSMGLVQYACLLAGCYTENPSLILPYLLGQIIVIFVKTINAFLLLTSMDKKSYSKLKNRIPAILLMFFNWTQEFCIFRQFICVCDL